MAWDGYFTLDGQEVINVARTEAYTENADMHWFKPAFDVPHLPEMLDHLPYTTPALDPAPWYDPDVPESGDFYGYYPLDVAGIDDSTRTSSVFESTVDGGLPGRLRHATKSAVFNGLLLGRNDKAVEYGMRWLSRVLLGNLCVGDPIDHGMGTTLTFLSSEPVEDLTVDPVVALDKITRTLRRFAVNNGPTINAKHTMRSCEGEAWVVQFTGVAGKPFMLGPESDILQGWLTSPAYPDVENFQPNSSFELDNTNWTLGVPGTLAFPTVVDAVHGDKVARLTATASGNLYIRSQNTTRIAVTAGQIGLYATAYAEARWRVGATPRAARIDVRFLNSSNVLIGSSNVGPTTTMVLNDWVRVHNDDNLIPANTAWIEVQVHGVSMLSGEGFDVDAIFVSIGDNIPITGPHPDFAIKNSEVPVPTVDPWVPGTTVGTIIGPDAFEETVCGEDVWEPIYDPLCPALVVPPAPPSIPLACFDPPATWDRRTVTLPADNTPLWGAVMPLITLYAPVALRNVRLRFYEDPTESLDPAVTPCSYASDIVISYIPAGGTMTIDSALEEVWVHTVNGWQRRADSLTFSTEGRPFVWPEFTCGAQHIMTLDTEVGSIPPTIGLSLVPKVV